MISCKYIPLKLSPNVHSKLIYHYYRNSNGKEYLLDSSSETQRCFLIGSRGPCGEMMTFYKNPLKKDLRGFCDCEQGHIDHNDSPIRKRIYHPKDQRCYTAFSQVKIHK